MGAEIVKIECGRKCDFGYLSHTEFMVSAFRIPPKSIERRLKKAFENGLPKKAFLFVSWALLEGERCRKRLPRGTARGP